VSAHYSQDVGVARSIGRETQTEQDAHAMNADESHTCHTELPSGHRPSPKRHKASQDLEIEDAGAVSVGNVSASNALVGDMAPFAEVMPVPGSLRTAAVADRTDYSSKDGSGAHVLTKSDAQVQSGRDWCTPAGGVGSLQEAGHAEAAAPVTDAASNPEGRKAMVWGKGDLGEEPVRAAEKPGGERVLEFVQVSQSETVCRYTASRVTASERAEAAVPKAASPGANDLHACSTAMSEGILQQNGVAPIVTAPSPRGDAVLQVGGASAKQPDVASGDQVSPFPELGVHSGLEGTFGSEKQPALGWTPPILPSEEASSDSMVTAESSSGELSAAGNSASSHAPPPLPPMHPATAQYSSSGRATGSSSTARPEASAHHPAGGGHSLALSERCSLISEADLDNNDMLCSLQRDLGGPVFANITAPVHNLWLNSTASVPFESRMSLGSETCVLAANTAAAAAAAAAASAPYPAMMPTSTGDVSAALPASPSTAGTAALVAAASWAVAAGHAAVPPLRMMQTRAPSDHQEAYLPSSPSFAMRHAGPLSQSDSPTGSPTRPRHTFRSPRRQSPHTAAAGANDMKAIHAPNEEAGEDFCDPDWTSPVATTPRTLKSEDYMSAASDAFTVRSSESPFSPTRSAGPKVTATTPNVLTPTQVTPQHARPPQSPLSLSVDSVPSLRSSHGYPLFCVPESPVTGGQSQLSSSTHQAHPPRAVSHRTSISARSEQPSRASSHIVSDADVQFMSPDSYDGVSWAPFVQPGGGQVPQQPLSPRTEQSHLRPPPMGPPGHTIQEDGRDSHLPPAHRLDNSPETDGDGACPVDGIARPPLPSAHVGHSPRIDGGSSHLPPPVGPLGCSAATMSPMKFGSQRQDMGASCSGNSHNTINGSSCTVHPDRVSAHASNGGGPSTPSLADFAARHSVAQHFLFERGRPCTALIVMMMNIPLIWGRS
jgi:hypothetical protein